jgi:hypothetical protein
MKVPSLRGFDNIFSLSEIFIQIEYYLQQGMLSYKTKLNTLKAYIRKRIPDPIFSSWFK